MENSLIGWTDHTHNHWRGCARVSLGCVHCYAETLSKRNPKTLGIWGKGQPRVLASEATRKLPLKWNKTVICGNCGKSELIGSDDCRHCGHELGMEPMARRPRVFCASLADVWDDEVPIEWLQNLLALIDQCRNLDWLLLTKRPENLFSRMNAAMNGNFDRLKTFAVHMPHVWLGVTAENQQMWDDRLTLLSPIHAAVKFVSVEPMLEAIQMGEHSPDWVICGGESGAGEKTRPMNPDWARNLRDQCVRRRVPFFFKQWGDWVRDADIHTQGNFGSKAVPYGDGDPTNFRRMYRVGKHRSGRLLDGLEWNQFPLTD